MNKELFFPWKNMYSLKIHEIDEQHKVLVKFINELYVSVSKKQDTEKSREIITKMSEYALFHFATEEAYFKKVNYDKSEEHILQHQSFIKKVSEFKEISDKNHPLTFRLVQYLKIWLTDHILIEDKKYVALFKAMNIN